MRKIRITSTLFDRSGLSVKSTKMNILADSVNFDVWLNRCLAE